MALKKVIKKSVTPMFKQSDYESMAKEYDEIRSQIKELTAKQKNLADQLKSGASSLGVKDDKGSTYIDGDSYIIGNVAKSSVKLDTEKAVKIFKSKGLKECYTEKKVVQYTINEAEVENAVSSEILTVDDVKSFTDVKTSYSVSVTKKEVAPEVEQSNLSVAKKK